MYRHAVAVEPGSWYRVDTDPGSSTPTTVLQPDGVTTVPNAYGLTGSTVRNGSPQGEAVFLSTVAPLYLKRLTYQGALSGDTPITSTGRDLTPTQPTDPSSTYAQPLKSGGALWAIGDSITDNGNAASQTGSREGTGGINFQPVSYLAYTLLNCGGRFRLGGVAATPGYIAAQIRDTHLPTVLAAKPAACIVLAGTNGATDLSGTTAALTTIYTSLRNAGIAAIPCTIPPQGTSTPTTPAAIYALNSWIKSYASANGLVYADIYAATTNPATGIYTSGYSSDGVHPTATGAEAMGKAIAAAATAAFWQPAAPLAAANITQQSMHANPLMVADADSDGIPDGWNLLIGLGTSTVTIPTVTGVAGKTLTETRADTDVLLSSAAYLTFTAGHRYRFACMLRGTASGTQNWSLRLEASDGGGFLVSFQGFTSTTPLTPLVFEFTVPSGLGVYTYVLRPWVQGTSGGKLEIGQVTLYDLTAAGLA